MILLYFSVNTELKLKGIKVANNLSSNLSSDSVELIDTGSTGRGTNEPGDGDFDFMVRLDKLLAEKPEKFKQALRYELGKNGIRKRPKRRKNIICNY